MKFFYLVWRNLTRRKLRTTLTLLSILVAFVMFGVLSAMKVALTGIDTIADNNRLIVRHRVSFLQLLPHAYMARIARIPGVDVVAHQTWFGGIFGEQKVQFATIAVDPATFLAMNPEYQVSPDEMQAWMTTRTGAIVGRELARKFGWEVGQRVPLISTIWPNKSGDAWEFDIVGIYDPKKKGVDMTSFFFRYDYFDEARAYGEGQVGWYQVRLDDPKSAAKISTAIDSEFANSAAETKSESEAAMFQGFVSQIGDIGKIVTAILGAVFFTILLVAANTMAQSVRERTQELGVLKAMGFSSELVLGVVLGEAITICLLGGGLGLMFGWMFVTGMGETPMMRQYFPLFALPARDIAIGAALALVLGVVTGALPGWQAMRLRVADALRREG